MQNILRKKGTMTRLSRCLLPCCSPFVLPAQSAVTLTWSCPLFLVPSQSAWDSIPRSTCIVNNLVEARAGFHKMAPARHGHRVFVWAALSESRECILERQVSHESWQIIAAANNAFTTCNGMYATVIIWNGTESFVLNNSSENPVAVCTNLAPPLYKSLVNNFAEESRTEPRTSSTAPSWNVQKCRKEIHDAQVTVWR